MAKKVLLWDPRFRDREPARLTVHDDIASAMVRAGIAAAADPAEAGPLSSGAAVDPSNLVETTLQHGLGVQLTGRYFLPTAVAKIAVGLGLGSALGIVADDDDDGDGFSPSLDFSDPRNSQYL